MRLDNDLHKIIQHIWTISRTKNEVTSQTYIFHCFEMLNGLSLQVVLKVFISKILKQLLAANIEIACH